MYWQLGENSGKDTDVVVFTPQFISLLYISMVLAPVPLRLNGSLNLLGLGWGWPRGLIRSSPWYGLSTPHFTEYNDSWLSHRIVVSPCASQNLGLCPGLRFGMAQNLTTECHNRLEPNLSCLQRVQTKLWLSVVLSCNFKLVLSFSLARVVLLNSSSSAAQVEAG